MLKTALSVYYDMQNPFPSIDEVVICTAQTTTEDVSYNFNLLFTINLSQNSAMGVMGLYGVVTGVVVITKNNI